MDWDRPELDRHEGEQLCGYAISAGLGGPLHDPPSKVVGASHATIVWLIATHPRCRDITWRPLAALVNDRAVIRATLLAMYEAEELDVGQLVEAIFRLCKPPPYRG